MQVDINALDCNSMTALMHAIVNNHEAVVTCKMMNCKGNYI